MTVVVGVRNKNHVVIGVDSYVGGGYHIEPIHAVDSKIFGKPDEGYVIAVHGMFAHRGFLEVFLQQTGSVDRIKSSGRIELAELFLEYYRWVREQQLIPLPDANEEVCSLGCGFFIANKKGLFRVGYTLVVHESDEFSFACQGTGQEYAYGSLFVTCGSKADVMKHPEFNIERACRVAVQAGISYCAYCRGPAIISDPVAIG